MIRVTEFHRLESAQRNLIEETEVAMTSFSPLTSSQLRLVACASVLLGAAIVAQMSLAQECRFYVHGCHDWNPRPCVTFSECRDVSYFASSFGYTPECTDEMEPYNATKYKQFQVGGDWYRCQPAAGSYPACEEHDITCATVPLFSDANCNDSCGETIVYGCHLDTGIPCP